MIPVTAAAPQLHYTLQPESHWIVSAGDEVCRGTPLARGRCYEHAAACGRVITVDGPHLVIQTRDDDAEVPMVPVPRTDRPAMLQRIQEAGVRGLGGAGFPTHLKLLAAARNRVHTLVVNAVECEPGIRCDAAIIAAATPVIREGIDAVRQLLGLNAVLIGCSPGTRLEHHDATTTCIDPVQPADGAERHLLQHLAGTTIPPRALPVDHGFIVLNVATLHAIARALAGEPLMDRVVTVFGENRRVPIGTPLTYLGKAAAEGFRIGGDLAGRNVPATAAVDKQTNAVDLARRHDSLPCIRCGACDAVCPERLPVALLVGRVQHPERETGRDDTILDCIACGLCNPVCPSDIDVAGLLRSARRDVHIARAKTDAAARAHERSTRHQQRAALRETEQALRRAQRLSRLSRPSENTESDEHA